ncbi:MAG: GAF domain-containing protein [Anaerolineales bacterium]|nr:GAF domain-containing protein [Anaerolineales bacterium]
MGTWLSLFFKTDFGISIWYFPTALGIALIYWWGPRVLVGIYLNTLVCMPLWGVPWEQAPFYGLPEILEIGLSWLFFVRLGKGKVYLPDLLNLGKFLLLGSLFPTLLADVALALQPYLSGHLDTESFWLALRVIGSADLTTHFVITAPLLILVSKFLATKKLTNVPAEIPVHPFLPEGRNSRVNDLFITATLAIAPLVMAVFQLEDLRIGYAFFLIFLSVRYGISVAAVGAGWVGLTAMFIPILTSKSLSSDNFKTYIDVNFNILFLSGVMLIIGRAISDFFEEIEERKQVEESVRSVERQYRALFEDSPIAIWEEDFSQVKRQLDFLRENGTSDFEAYFSEHPKELVTYAKLVKVLNVNRAAIKLEQAPSKEALLSNLYEATNPKSLKYFRKELINIAHGIQAFKFEMKYPTLTNEEIYVNINWTVMPGHEADYSKVIISMEDITQRKLVEETLRAAEEKYRTLVEQIPPIIYTAGVGQHIGATYISPQIKTLGFTPEEWLNAPQLWLERLYPDDKDRVLERIAQIIKNREPFKEEYRLITKGGEVRWILDEVAEVRDKQGTALYRQGFMLDITARKQAEESLLAREKFLKLLNDMTQTILLADDFEETLSRLAYDIAKLTNADDCYVTQWDEKRQQAVFTASTVQIKIPTHAIDPNDINLTASVLKTGRALAIEDVLNSPYINSEFIAQYPTRSMLSAPLIVGEQKLGAIIIAFNTAHPFTPMEIERAEQAGAQVALALWNFKQELEIQRRLKESQVLTKIGRALGATELSGVSDVLQLIADSALELIQQAQKSVIHLLDVDEQVLIARAVSGYHRQDREKATLKMKLGEGVAGQAIQEGRAINIKDISASPNFVTGDAAPTFRSLLVVPIQSGKNLIGTISLHSDQTNAFSAEEINLLNGLGVQAAISIENTKLFEATQQSLKEVQALYKINQGLAASLDPGELIREVITLLQQNFGYYHVQIYLVDPESRELLLQHNSGYLGNKAWNAQYQIPAGEGIPGHVAETGEAFFTNNVEGVVFFKRNPLLPETQSEIAVPIKVDREVVGVLDVQNRPHQRFTESDFQLMITVANQLAVALQRATLYGNLQISLQQEQAVRSQLIQSERLAVMGRLLASVSHELNNPLQAIQNALFLLKSESGLSAQGKLDLETVLAESERMASLIAQLRATYRPMRVEEFKEVQINATIQELYALIGTMLRHNQVAFVFNPDPELPTIPAIQDQIRQALLNLIVNAGESMSASGGTLTICTDHCAGEAEILITISDTGPGIAPEILAHIFEAFITNKETGTGLGLTITHDIIHKHRGRIEAKNLSERGAMFKVWLPKTFIEIE